VIKVIKENHQLRPHKKAEERRPPDQKLKTKNGFSQNFVEHLIRVLKIFRVASERFRLNPSKYEQIIMTICGVVRLRIELVFPL